MLLQRIDLKQFVIMSIALHALFMGVMTITKGSETKVIQLGFGTDPTKSAGGGEGAMRGQMRPIPLSFPMPTKAAAVTRPAPVKKMAKTQPTTTTPTALSTASAPADGQTSYGNGVGTGRGDGIGSGDGGGENSVKAKYFTEVAKLIEKNKKYPMMAKRLGHHGLVVVEITLGKDGNILDAKISEGVKFSSLREASLENIKSISAFPQIPEALGVSEISFSVPIKYHLQ